MSCILCSLVLASCSREVSLEDPMQDYSGELVSVFDGENSSYKIVRADLANEEETASSIYLRNTLSEKYGYKFQIATDFVERGGEVPTDTNEILIGLTNRQESIDAAKTLGSDDFAVLFQNNRIVIIGGSGHATKEAVEYFIEKICVDSDKLEVPKNLSLISKSDYRYNGITLKGKNISEYSISSESEVAGLLLADNIKILSGVQLSDGGSGDNINLRYADENRIFFEGNDLVISGKDELSLIYGIASLFDKFDEKSDSENVKLDAIDMAFEELPSGITSQGFTLFNMSRSCLVVSSDSNIVGMYDRRNGENHMDSRKASPFALLTDSSGEIGSVSFKLDNGNISVGFIEKSYSFSVTLTEDFVSFKLLDELSEDECLRFLNLNLDIGKAANSKDDFSVNGYSMTYYLNPSDYPLGTSRSIGLSCYGKHESAGAVGALIASPKSETMSVIKSANEYIEDGMVGLSNRGGANAADYAETNSDYIIVSTCRSENVDEYIDICNKYSINQLDIQGDIFLNGSFELIDVGSDAEYKKTVTDPLKENGIIAGLHTFSFYIDKRCVDILSDPTCQSQLHVLNEYTLSSDLTETSDKVYLAENHKISVNTNYSAKETNYFLIDNEIVLLVSVGKDYLYVDRAQCGTAAAPHTANSVVKHLGGGYGKLAPDIDSDLFLQTARNIAEACNKGGFSMIYLDAFEGMQKQTDEIWYYSAKYVNELLKYIEDDPILEASFITPSLWISRSRAGTLDSPRRAYKLFIDNHVETNEIWCDVGYPSTLGWYNLSPNDSTYPGNTLHQYHFIDDVDYIGVKSVAYDMGFSHNSLADLESYPAMKRNMERFALYSRLRQSDYFSDEVKEKIKEGEYALQETDSGEYVFVEKSYTENVINDLAVQDTFYTSNPYAEQTPFIRIEGRLSSLGEDSEPIYGSASSDGEKNLGKRTALKCTVTGNGSKDGSICVRLTCTSGAQHSTYDYIVPVNFEGTREVILCEADNGAFNLAEYGLDVGNSTEYCISTFNTVTNVAIYTNGSCEGAAISDIEMCAAVENALINPTVTVNGKTIAFDCSIASDEYLEYDPQTNTAKVYDKNGFEREAVVSGEISVPNGEFSVRMSAKSGNEAAPTRMNVTFGFTGEEIG